MPSIRQRASRACRVHAVSALACAIALGSAASTWGQTAPVDGPRASDLRAHAITDTTVVIRPGESIDRATIVIRDGLIESVGADVTPPRDARIWDGKDLTVYAGLIDSALLVDASEFKPGPAAHWNPMVRPEILVSELDLPDEQTAKTLRDLGFTTAAVYPQRGIFRGVGTVVTLAGAPHQPNTFVERGALAVAFDRGGGYPNSQMGAISVFRQAMNDARWYGEAMRIWKQFPQFNEPPAKSDALEALQSAVRGEQTLLFDVSDEHNFLRAARLLEEFQLNGVILGSGEEFRRLREVLQSGLPIVLPLRYPDRPNVSTLDQADSVTLQTLLDWEQAPTNPRKLIHGGATVALTTNGLRNRGDFYSNLRRAITNGLTPDEALAAVTTTPARMLGIDHLVGSVERGKVANLVVVEKTLFDKDMKVRDVWVDGRRYEVNKKEDPSYIGTGVMTVKRVGAEDQTHSIQIDTKKRSVTIKVDDETSYKAKTIEFDGQRLSFLIDGRAVGSEGYVQFVGTLTKDEFTGSGALPDRSRFTFAIARTSEDIPDETAEDDSRGGADEGGNERGDRRTGDRAQDARTDPVTGDWSAALAAEQMPGGSMPIALSLKSNEDGSVSGSLESEFFNADITNGTFDQATGDLKFTVEAGGSSSTFMGRIENNTITGSVIGQGGFNAEISGERDVVASAGARRGGSRSSAEENDVAPEVVLHPLMEFGRAKLPVPESVLVHSATIWTSGPRGVIDNGWMLVRDGRIAEIGSGVWPDVAVDRTIDASGSHVTPGLIDCHSHTGISGGVNEGSQSVTAEVRIGDVVHPDDINFYRQLAGGLTACNQLHGSANPIGGQNSVVKLKWGGSVDDMRVTDAIPGIKFALGENVKRSPNRYPNTRMGVETTIRDAFERAEDYRDEWNRYRALSSADRAHTIPPQIDLELETLVEILEHKRLVHCHSYRQDEILMLLRVAEDFGFTVGTLQHILEGYKIGEAIAAHGAGASTFSDWWAYKVEVMDAIPFNGALMDRLGIVVSFNSDSSELARRMNTEAAKAVRYGGLTPEKALNFVTINPAKQLRIDHRVGSLEVGKDADFVIWSGDPLSTYTRCEQTWIEGARYFSLEEDLQLRKQVAAERQRLIQKILAFEHGDLEEDKGEEEKTTETAQPEGAVLRSMLAVPF